MRTSKIIIWITGVIVGLFALLIVGMHTFLGYKVAEVDAKCPIVESDAIALVEADYDSFFHSVYTYKVTNTVASGLIVAAQTMDIDAFREAVVSDICGTNELVNEYSMDLTVIYYDASTKDVLFKVDMVSEECEAI